MRLILNIFIAKNNTNISPCFPSVSTSPTSGIFPTPQPARSGPLTSSTHHASFPAASSPSSGSGPPPAHFQHRSSSFGHSHSGARDRVRRRPHREGSRLHECHGITGAHGNNTNVVTRDKKIPLAIKPKHTPGFSLSPICFSLRFSIYLAKRGRADRRRYAPVMGEKACGAMKDGWIWRLEDGSTYQHVFIARLSWSLPKLLYEEDEVYSLVCSLLCTSAVTTRQRTILGFSAFWSGNPQFHVLFFLYI